MNLNLPLNPKDYVPIESEPPELAVEGWRCSDYDFNDFHVGIHVKWVRSSQAQHCSEGINRNKMLFKFFIDKKIKK